MTTNIHIPMEASALHQNLQAAVEPLLGGASLELTALWQAPAKSIIVATPQTDQRLVIESWGDIAWGDSESAFGKFSRDMELKPGEFFTGTHLELRVAGHGLTLALRQYERRRSHRYVDFFQQCVLGDKNRNVMLSLRPAEQP